jgi:hypothetical protein
MSGCFQTPTHRIKADLKNFRERTSFGARERKGGREKENNKERKEQNEGTKKTILFQDSRNRSWPLGARTRC